MPAMPGSFDNILAAVGQTPIVRLNKMGAHTKAEIYVKCEYMNPGGSTKDRIAINIVNDAEKRGCLQPGGTIVEATSGNTGMGLALVAAVRGYKAVFVMPDKMSDEKIKALRAVGAKVVICPTDVAPEDPRSYYSVSRRIAEETPNAYYANQYHNPANPEAHTLSTGPEIWAQTEGQFDVFCAGMGTGGTLSGVGKYFREQNPNIQIVGVDPVGSLYYDYFKSGKLTEAHPYKVEGIGEDFLPSTMNLKILDEVVRVTDRECFVAARDLSRLEGILAGGSAGAAVAGAINYAQAHDKPMRIIVHLPDSASRYLSKYLDDDWMRENGFAEPERGLGNVGELLASLGQRNIQSVTMSTGLRDVIGKMKEHGISQMPVFEGNRVMGLISESEILRALVDNSVQLDAQVGPLVEKSSIAVVQGDTPVRSAVGLLDHAGMLLVMDSERLTGWITKIDLIEYMARGLVGH